MTQKQSESNEIEINIETIQETNDNNDCYQKDDSQLDGSTFKSSTNEKTPLMERRKKLLDYKFPEYQRYNKCHIFISLNVLLLSIPLPIIGFLYCLLCIGRIKSQTLKELRRIIFFISLASTVLYLCILFILLLTILLNEETAEKFFDLFR